MIFHFLNLRESRSVGSAMPKPYLILLLLLFFILLLILGVCVGGGGGGGVTVFEAKTTRKPMKV